jgi:hypothetical protein
MARFRWTSALLNAVLAAILLSSGCNSVKPKPLAAVEDSGVKILNFYARDGDVVEGKSTVLCYAVENAKAVSIDPPSVDAVWPSRNRCIEVNPDRETQYTLTAEGPDGRSVTQSLSLHVSADTDVPPSVTSFAVKAVRGIMRTSRFTK